MIRSTANLSLDDDGKIKSGKPSNIWPKHGIYAVVVNSEVIRFGESGSGFKRINTGFNHALQFVGLIKNYSAYRWRTKYANSLIEIRYYTLDSVTENAMRLEDPEVRRGIEAELAFQFRLNKKKWPQDMIEIHFYNSAVESTSTIGFLKDILRDLNLHYFDQYDR